MPRLISFLLFIFFGFTLKAQTSYVDSLKRLLDKATDDSSRIMLNCQICDQYLDSQPDTALFYAERGLKLANDSPFEKGQARCLTRIGSVFNYKGSLDKALEKHLESLHISERVGDLMGVAASYNNMAEIFRDLKDYPQALDYYLQASTAFEKIIRDIELIKKKELIEKNKDKLIRNKGYLATAFMNIGYGYEQMKRYDSSIFYYNKAFNLATNIDDRNTIGAVYTNMGSVFFRLGQNDESLINYKKAIPFLEETEDDRFLSNVYNGVAENLERKNQMDSAIFYSKKALDLAQNGSFPNEIMISDTLLSKFYESINTDSALHYSKLARPIYDSLQSVEKANEVQRLKVEEKQRLLEALTKAKERKENQEINLQNLAIVIFIITLFIILFILGRRKTHPKAIESLGLLTLLLMFEFISIFLHPYIGKITHHRPIYILLIYVAIASLLVPLHHRLNHWVKEKLAVRHQSKEEKIKNKVRAKPITHTHPKTQAVKKKTNK